MTDQITVREATIQLAADLTSDRDATNRHMHEQYAARLYDNGDLRNVAAIARAIHFSHPETP